MPESFKPPASVARIARRGLAIRAKQPPSNRAGTRVGLARANQLARRDMISIATIKRMVSFFARHEKSAGSAQARQDPTSKASQAWALWGGNPGRAWAKRVLRLYEQIHTTTNTIK